MNFYVDSNFLLESVFQQEEAYAAHLILTLTENKSITLVCPCLALCEPFSKISYLRLERNRINSNLASFSKELQRSPEHFTAVQDIKKVMDYAESLDHKQSADLHREALRLLNCARILPLDYPTLHFAAAFQRDYDLKLSDAIVAASIVMDLETQRNATHPTPSIFASRDKDLANISEELKKHDCAFIPNFHDAVKRIEALLKRPPQDD